MNDIVCQAREFALYLVINREPLSDFNPGNDYTCILKDNFYVERDGRLRRKRAGVRRISEETATECSGADKREKSIERRKQNSGEGKRE